MSGNNKMGIDFDLPTYVDNLKATKPPYECPKCGRVYKSYSGIRFHLLNHDHNNLESIPSPASSTTKKIGKKKNSKLNNNRLVQRSPTPPDLFRNATRETLTYAEAQRMVEVELEGRIHRINIFDPLEVINQDEIDNQDNTEKEEKLDKTIAKSAKNLEQALKKKEASASPHHHHHHHHHGHHTTSRLPEASFKVLDDYVKPPTVPARPSSYYRYIDKASHELDDDVEYDMDEEDHAWLELINDTRKEDGHTLVTQEMFETLMDRFEKEAFFHSQSSGNDMTPSIDEDAVCSICMDGECQNSNVILFCDMCNLAVHQECYGVPYIPEGQWLCRRCLQSPSTAVDCSLCPNKGGAFKQTDDGHWAHVVCALWIPEVGFANTVFLEPIDSIDHIPAARWKLSCYICKQRGTGACIQCHKTNCYTAFHVTCAQQAGLYMKIEPVRETGIGGTSFTVRKTAFCDVHAPADHHNSSDNTSMLVNSEEQANLAKRAKAISRQKMRKARKILAEKRNAMPIVSIPVIPQQRLAKIASRIVLQRKNQFIGHLQSYWTLKRQSRNGVPLLRRLQSNHMSRHRDQTQNDKESDALKDQLKYWQRLRQDLEKARLLVELIRKREKMKREQVRIIQMNTEMQLQPFNVLLRKTLDQLQEKDIGNIFAEPVNGDEVPDYYSYIKNPMDFLTMRQKVNGHQYKSIDAFEADFDLTINNCMKYNAKDTVFYRAAVRLRDQGGAIIRSMRRTAEQVGYDMETGLHLKDRPKLEREPIATLEDIDSFLPPDVRADMPLEEQLRILLDKMDIANSQPGNGKKSRLAKQIKREIVKVRRQLALQKGSATQADLDGSTVSDTEKDSATPRTPVKTKYGRLTKTPRSAMKRGDRDSSTTPPRTVGRGRKRGRKPRSSVSELPVEQIEEANTEEIVSEDKKPEPATPQKSSTGLNSERSTSCASPSGVNRRTAVLFSKKAYHQTKLNLTSTNTSSTPVRKGPGRPPKIRPSPVVLAAPEDTIKEESEKEEEPKPVNETSEDVAKLAAISAKPGRGRKRSASVLHVETDLNPAKKPALGSPTPKSPKPSVSTSPKSPKPVAVATPVVPTKICSKSVKTPRSPGPTSSPRHHSTPMTECGDIAFPPAGAEHPESFMRYRIDHSMSSCDDSTSCSETENTDSSDCESCCSGSSIGGDDDKSARFSQRGRHIRTKTRFMCEDEEDEVIPLEPLDLVWAKCRGYPWYPALIINPKMPKTGYFHNGVPIPVPPDDVLQLQKRHDDLVYLVLFFDTKRTWQWLPRNKLEPLGVDSGLDQAKLLENKKLHIRKAVRKAYEKAISHRCRVTGEPNPLSSESSTED
ncbi:peregrin-like isoform X2 [Tubulanus polymorphus]|uniref:peregrin-like isoform X2 n=1 Tax=Tubulanus polymorphus TaxID=672921 RepID=UPI003DA66F18